MSRKLDALFEEKVLGVTFNDSANPFRMMPNYTTSLDAAWAGVEKHINGQLFSTAFWLRFTQECTYEAKFIYPRDCTSSECGIDKTAPMAVVKACLLAVGVTQEEIE